VLLATVHILDADEMEHVVGKNQTPRR
jgi:hypothetical protein